MKNPLTTICGIVTLIGFALKKAWPEYGSLADFLQEIGIGAGLILARDWNKSSEDMGLKTAAAAPAGKTSLAIVLTFALGLALLQTSCSSVAPGSDPVVVRAEQTTSVAVDLFDAFLKWEKANRPTMGSAPQIKMAADRIRDNGIAWLDSARNLTKAYKQNRTPENKANLETALVVIDVALKEARNYIEHAAEWVPPTIPK